MKLQILTNFDKVLKTLTTHFSQSNHLIVVILYEHQYLTTFFQSNGQILDLGSKALWTCVILLEHQEISIDHILSIQPFDWAQNLSKPIFYPTLSIQWSNFKSDSGTRWTHVIVSTYHETSITKNIQYSSKRIIHFINIIKNGENELCMVDTCRCSHALGNFD